MNILRNIHFSRRLSVRPDISFGARAQSMLLTMAMILGFAVVSLFTVAALLLF